MTLLEEIQAKCSQEQIAERNFHIIADVVSTGRTRPNQREIGNGTILDVLGLTKGNALLDLIHGNPQFKYVVPLLDQGRLIVSSTLVASTIQSLVPALLTQEEADALLSIGHTADPVTWEQCQAAFIEAGL